ncbi:MAG: hypothetical protein ACLFV7_02705 [Phycisphaerae bacterium]
MKKLLTIGAVLLVWAGASADEGKKSPERTDLYGDPLPKYAVSRLGTLRFRQAGQVRALSFSPDGKRLASIGHGIGGGGLIIWDVRSGRPLKNVKLDGQRGTSVAYSPDGEKLLWTDNNNAAYVLDLESGKRRKLSLPAYGYRAAWSPDGSMIAAASYKGVRVWRTKDYKQVRSLPKGTAVAFSPDNKRLVVADMSYNRRKGRPLVVYEVDTGKKVMELGQKRKRYIDIGWSDDGKYIAGAQTGGAKCKVDVWDGSSGKHITEIGGFRYYARQISFVPGENQIVAAEYSGSGKAGIYDVKTGKQIRALKGADNRTLALAVSPGARYVASAGSDQVIHVWDVETGKPLHQEAGHSGVVTSGAFSPDGRHIATGGHDKTVRLWDADTGKPVRTYNGHRTTVIDLKFSPDGKLIGSSGMNGQDDVYLWHADKGGHRHRFSGPKYAIKTVQFGNAGESFYVATQRGEVNGWDTDSGKTVYNHKLHRGRQYFYGVRLSPDACFLGTIRNQEVTIFKLATKGTVMLPMSSRAIYGQQCAFSPGGDLFAWPTTSGVTVVEVISGREVASLSRGRTGSRTGAMSFSHSGRYLAAGLPDGSLGVWDLYLGRRVKTLQGHRRDKGGGKNQGRSRMINGRVIYIGGRGGAGTGIAHVAFSPDDKRLVTTGTDSTAMVWDLQGALGKQADLAADIDLGACWDTLAYPDARDAYEAYSKLNAAGSDAVTFLAEKLRPVKRPSPEVVADSIDALDSEDYRQREEAYANLDELGPMVREEVSAALKDPPGAEVKRRLARLLANMDSPLVSSPGVLRELRAIRVLQRNGSDEAMAVLKSLTGGLKTAPQTSAAKEALRQLQKQRGSTPKK